MPRRLADAGLLAGLAGLLMALRVTLGGEIWLDRTYWLTGLVTLGAFAGGLAAPWLATWRLAQRILPSPRIAAAFLFAGGLMVASALGNAGYQTLIRQPDFHPDRPIINFLATFAAAFAGFFVASPAYLLPWIVPVLMLAAAFLLPRGEG